MDLASSIGYHNTTALKKPRKSSKMPSTTSANWKFEKLIAPTRLLEYGKLLFRFANSAKAPLRRWVGITISSNPSFEDWMEVLKKPGAQVGWSVVLESPKECEPVLGEWQCIEGARRQTLCVFAKIFSPPSAPLRVSQSALATYPLKYIV